MSQWNSAEKTCISVMYATLQAAMTDMHQIPKNAG